MDFGNVTEAPNDLLQRLNNAAVWKLHEGNTDHALAVLKDLVTLLQTTPELLFSAINSLMVNNDNKRNNENNMIIPILEIMICNLARAEEGGGPLASRPASLQQHHHGNRPILMKQKETEDYQVAYVFGRGIMLGATNMVSFWNNRKGYEDIGETECAAVRCSIIFYNVAVAYHKSSILHHGFTDTAKGMNLLKKARSFYSMSMNLLTSSSAVFLDLFHRLCVSDDRKLLTGLVNNLGQIHFSLGHYEFGRHYFRQSQYWLEEMASYSSLLYTSEELSGLAFNAMVLANAEEARQYDENSHGRRVLRGENAILLVGSHAPVA